MDPIAHTFVGATLAASGLRRKTPLATAVLLMGANAPDIDVLSGFGAPFQSLELRRGLTHGVLALAILPFALTGLVLLFDRVVRRKRVAGAEPVRAGALLGLATLAVLTHPALDWLNNYGMRWLMPFDGRWSYGDAVFIIDPWIWLALGGVPFLVYSRRTASLVRWCVFWSLASLLVLLSPVPLLARLLWIAGVGALLAVRFFRPTAPGSGFGFGFGFEHAARIALGIAAVYVSALALVDFAERSQVTAELAARGIGPVERVMVAPVAANPFTSEVLVETPEAYHAGTWRWLADPKLELDPEMIPKRMADPIAAAAAQTLEARRYLTWARFPYAVIESEADGYVVRLLDARYHATGRLYGPTVRLDLNLRPLPHE
jgi:inner membrane protein